MQYGLKKKEIMKEEEPDVAGRLGRKKKSPAELAAENDPENEEGSNISSHFIFLYLVLEFPDTFFTLEKNVHSSILSE